MIKLLANENFPLDSVIYLAKKGYDIKAIGTDHQGVRDTEVLKIAQEEQRLILTFDRDYGELIFKHNYRPEKGIIYVRLQTYDSDEPGKSLLIYCQIYFLILPLHSQYSMGRPSGKENINHPTAVDSTHQLFVRITMRHTK